MRLPSQRCFAALILLLLFSPLASPASDLVLDLGGGVSMELVRVPAGTFEQGSPANEKDRGDDELLRRVTISKDYFIGKYPVTRAQYARFVDESRYKTEAEKGTSGGFGWDGQALVQKKEFTWRNPGFRQTDKDPVVIVTYDDAVAFAKWLTRKAKREVWLPTEAQWEYACRAGTKSRFYSGNGDKNAEAIAWFKSDGTRPVGGKKGNEWKIFDMSGNVYEWCRDWYGPYDAGSATDPEQTNPNLSDKPRRVLRGGSWLKEARHCRSAARYRNTPGSRNADNGFRVVAGLEERAAETVAPTREQRHEESVAPGGTNSASNAMAGLILLASLILPAVFVIGILLFAMRLFRRRDAAPGGFSGRVGSNRIRPDDFIIAIDADGFWLQLPGNASRLTVHYSARLSRGDKTDSVTMQESKQFVYTGERPADVKVTGVFQDHVASGSDSGWRRPQDTWDTFTTRDHTTQDTSSSSSTFSGFPSAY